MGFGVTLVDHCPVDLVELLHLPHLLHRTCDDVHREDIYVTTIFTPGAYCNKLFVE